MIAFNDVIYGQPPNLLSRDGNFNDRDPDHAEHVLDAMVLQGLNNNLESFNFVWTHFSISVKLLWNKTWQTGNVIAL